MKPASMWMRLLKFGLSATLLLASAASSAETWRFALIGDTPYNDYERSELPRLLEHIAEQNVEFVAHIGDIKSGSSRCDDALFEDRRQLFNGTRIPFVLIPGDNEWTDCHRLSNGSYDPLERLAKLRKLFWNDSYSLGRKKLALERQSIAYPENSRFRIGPVLFVTLNLPGSFNNFGLTNEPTPEFVARNPVVLEWLKDSFAVANRQKLAGIVLLFQANPGFRHFMQGLGHNGYREFLETLRQETQGFPGQVVAVHGDTHISHIDQPMRNPDGTLLNNFVRVETHGYPTMGWTRGIIDTENPALFRFEAYPWPH